ncbi:hypothetical protein [Carboxydocella sp. JDF658]|uniref:hypothetical protein n=1 Tax=Carboxydocella sp. JDF658 TaxID=1926600 RepID=UPI0009ABAF86|nr:hypothetical protein [Carboxydocella sp. JDF658]GAW32179.1 hypothetical protein JDF658_19440 [Carboxydocella sp. JDF658]
MERVVKKFVDSKARELILAVDDFTKDQEVRNILAHESFGTNQIRRLVELAEQAACIEELEEFIKYKETKHDGWEKTVNNNSIAQLLLEQIKNIKKMARESGIQEQDRLTRKLVARFCGYLYWKVSSF